MDLDLTDKVAVVTGANKGIGLAITEALVAEGAFVVAGALTTENLEGIERVAPVQVDLLGEDGPASLVRKAIDVHDRLDVLVNNVGGVRIRVDGFLSTGDEEFGPKGIRVNCVSPGQVSTDLWLGEHGVAATFADATGVDADTIRATAAAAIATGRFSTPQEVAPLVTLLASDRTANVTGVNYVIDGGLVKTT